jgi:pyruvate/2-oxoglutarate dehydrogenase complex dihydrolipoamide dehydrogenase (E3) component
MSAQIFPLDGYNQALLANVHPPAWVNPKPTGRYNLVVIGAGTAGLVTAAGAAGLGAKVALIEKDYFGGDCLNFGCIPSKTLIRSARAAADVRDAARFGIKVPPGAEVDFAAVMERVRRLRAEISRHDSAQRMRELGIDVFIGPAQFLNSETVEVAERRLEFKRAVIATGARAALPEIEGIGVSGFLTNESVFNLTQLPRRLAVIGGGPIGCELAQAFQRLGAQVSLVHQHAHLLDREDLEAAEIVQRRFLAEGMRLELNCRCLRVVRTAAGKFIEIESGGVRQSITVDEILTGTGRLPNVDGLNLEGVGVEFDRREGVLINDRLQTSNPNIYAAGDVCLKWKFTHTADATARIVIQNTLFHGRKKLSALTVPWCTYTDPEIAHVGLRESEAAGRGIALDSFATSMDRVDRAITDGETEGFAKIHVEKGTDRILGGTIVSRHAGELISELSLAMTAGVGLGKLAAVFHPYPTQAEAIKKTADAYNRTRLTPAVKSLFAKWLEWTR